ncbi:MAG: hypothetical protein U0Q22_11145 [Acidimicrobiales bacterium]
MAHRDREPSMTVTDVLGLVASAVFIARLTPQPVRLARSGVAEGVSPLSALNAVIAAVAWLVYGLVADLPIVWIVSLLAILPGVWAVLLLRRHTVLADVLWASAWVGVIVAAAAAGLLAAALGLGVVVTQGPQVWRACRDHDLSGLSPVTWWLSILDALTWGAYGIAVGDPALIGYAAVLSTSAVVVLSRLWWVARARNAAQAAAASQTAPT